MGNVSPPHKMANSPPPSQRTPVMERSQSSIDLQASQEISIRRSSYTIPRGDFTSVRINRQKSLDSPPPGNLRDTNTSERRNSRDGKVKVNFYFYCFTIYI